MAKAFHHGDCNCQGHEEEIPHIVLGMVCKHCGKPSRRRLNSSHKDIVCKECKDRLYQECESCGDYYPKNSLAMVCDFCLEHGWDYPTGRNCFLCGSHKGVYRSQNSDGSIVWICKDCSDACPKCEACDHRILSLEGQNYCKSCINIYGFKNRGGIMFTGWLLEMVKETPIIGLGTVRLLEGLGKDYWIGECECCTRNIPMFKGMYEKINGGYFCKTCTPTLVGCCNCSNVLEKDIDPINYIHGDAYCDKCYEELPVCEDCGDVVTEDDTHIDILGRGNTVLCRSCADTYVQCESCRNYLHEDDTIRDDETCLCQDCYDNYYSTCNRCESIIYQDNAHYDEYSDETLCRDCHRRIEQEIIDYDPDIEVLYVEMEQDESFTIGCELEFECSGNRAEIARYVYEEYRNLLWSKTDGSLSSDNGLETPTQPMTWEYWERFGKDELKDYFKYLNNRGCRAWRTSAGLHVSLGRSGFSTGHLYKFLKFFYENPEYIFKISRRSEDKFNKWCDCRTLDRKGLAKKFREGKDCHGDKYEAVNLQHHSHIEVRIFAGTLNWESFLANIEFCRGLYEYTMNESIKEVSVRNFQNFMWENREAFPHFYTTFAPTYQHAIPFNDCHIASNAHKGIA